MRCACKARRVTLVRCARVWAHHGAVVRCECKPRRGTFVRRAKMWAHHGIAMPCACKARRGTFVRCAKAWARHGSVVRCACKTRRGTPCDVEELWAHHGTVVRWANTVAHRSLDMWPRMVVACRQKAKQASLRHQVFWWTRPGWAGGLPLEKAPRYGNPITIPLVG